MEFPCGACICDVMIGRSNKRCHALRVRLIVTKFSSKSVSGAYCCLVLDSSCPIK